MRLFSLHSDVCQLAMEGSKGGSKKGKKPAADGGVEVRCWQCPCG
jgi:hypothetical protein